MAKFNSVILMGIIAAAIGMVSAITEDERKTLKEAVIPLLTECSKEFKISKEEILAAKDANNLDALNPCYYACVFKKGGAINDQGLYDPVAIKAQHKQFIHGEDDLKKLDAVADTCTAVNDQSVSDGAQGCERAKLLARCLIDNKAVFTPLQSAAK